MKNFSATQDFYSCLLLHRSQIKVLDGEDEYYKLLSTQESIPEEEHTTESPPTLSNGPLVSQRWSPASMSACKKDTSDTKTDRQTVQRKKRSALEVLEQVESVQDEQLVQTLCLRLLIQKSLLTLCGIIVQMLCSSLLIC